MVYLEFEKPLEKLHSQLGKLQEIIEDGEIDMSDKIKELEQKIKKKQKEIYSNLTDWQRVQLSRHPERPYTLYYINNITKGFEELHGDRCFGDDEAIVGGLAMIDNMPVVIVGQQKGINTKERQRRNFGMANPEGYRKALRLMKMAEKFELPVITFVDTPGAACGLEAEERSVAQAIAQNLIEMAQLRTPILVYVIGEGASGGAIGIGLGDRVFMLENTWYSVISPESCSSILWRSWDYKQQAAEALKLTAKDMLEFGIIDDIVKEPLGGAHFNPEGMAKLLKKHIKKQLKEVSEIPIDTLLEQRVKKFEQIGQYEIVGE